MNHRLHLMCCLVVVATLGSCGQPKALTLNLGETREDGLRELRAHIPVGSKMAEARRLLEENHFSCGSMVDQSWMERPHLDYVYCDRESSGVVHTRWQVMLLRQGERVQDVDAQLGLTGP